ncbi:hypothetical protein SESBI_21310 [Sesbania bispinosa]|nr:hypothetical protein SESBI_21310 [Sesbania bispinosa]
MEKREEGANREKMEEGPSSGHPSSSQSPPPWRNPPKPKKLTARERRRLRNERRLRQEHHQLEGRGGRAVHQEEAQKGEKVMDPRTSTRLTSPNWVLNGGSFASPGFKGQYTAEVLARSLARNFPQHGF